MCDDPNPNSLPPYREWRCQTLRGLAADIEAATGCEGFTVGGEFLPLAVEAFDTLCEALRVLYGSYDPRSGGFDVRAITSMEDSYHALLKVYAAATGREPRDFDGERDRAALSGLLGPGRAEYARRQARD